MTDDTKKPLNIFLLFFALVGFLASSVTVIDFLRPEEVSSLQVEIYPSEFRTPNYAGLSVQSASFARNVALDLREAACENANEELVVQTDRENLRKLELQPAELKAHEQCKDVVDIEFAARWTGEYSESDSQMIRYKIKNVGRKTANDLRIQAEQLNTAQYKVGNEYVEAKKEEGSSDYFELPDLNPNEEVTVLTWVDGIPLSTKYSEWDDFPRVTFAGSEVHTELYKPVPDGWYNTFEFFDTAPIIIQVAVVVLLAFLIVLVTWLIFAIPAALISGRPISELFISKPDKDPTNQDAESNEAAG